MPYPTNPDFYSIAKNIRPLTDEEAIRDLVVEVYRRCPESDLPAYIETVRNLRDDTAALREFLFRELEAIDARSTRQDEADLRMGL